jgi:predicted amidohydrolase YtcJ
VPRIFTARRIITMNPSQPDAIAVAVHEGRILSVGSLDHVQSAVGDATVDRQFEDKVLMPGLIEPHMHALMSGLQWQSAYLGYYDRVAPDGTAAPGCRDKAAILDRLGKAIREWDGEGGIFTAWGIDPSLLGDATLTAADLDAVCGDVPVLVHNTSGHIDYANSEMLRLAGIDASTNVEGIVKDADGNPTGEIREMRAMALLRPLLAGHTPERMQRAVRDAGRMAVRAGCTTISDWAFGLQADALDACVAVTREEDYPARLALAPFAPILRTQAGSPEGAVEAWREMKRAEHERLIVRSAKFMVDGSIQGFTGLMRWPVHHNGAPNGIANTTPEQLTELMRAFHRAGVQCVTHTNGDAAIDMALDAIETVLTELPRPDHRFRLEHVQMGTRDQFERMAKLGVGAVLFPVHLYFWGDVHRTVTIGPDRAARMNAVRTALDTGVRVAFHSDEPVTPVGPLFSAWCAVNRKTASGFVLGEPERIRVTEALRAITIDAAYLQHRDRDAGSIEVGKLADFAVLEADPLAENPSALKDIPVWGTVLAGEPHPATSA